MKLLAVEVEVDIERMMQTPDAIDARSADAIAVRARELDELSQAVVARERLLYWLALAALGVSTFAYLYAVCNVPERPAWVDYAGLAACWASFRATTTTSRARRVDEANEARVRAMRSSWLLKKLDAGRRARTEAGDAAVSC